MLKELSSHITGRNTRIYIESERKDSPYKIYQIISFLQEVVKQYSVEYVEELLLDDEEVEYGEYKYFISCTILIPVRKEDWDRQAKEAQEEKDRRLTKYLELKKEFEK